MSEREEQGVGAETDRSDRVEKQASAKTGEQAGFEGKRDGGKRDGERTDEDVETPRRERMIELRGDRPKQER